MGWVDIGIINRRGGDSNPRYTCVYNGFQDRRVQPLCHLSTGRPKRAYGNKLLK